MTGFLMLSILRLDSNFGFEDSLLWKRGWWANLCLSRRGGAQDSLEG